MTCQELTELVTNYVEGKLSFFERLLCPPPENSVQENTVAVFAIDLNQVT